MRSETAMLNVLWEFYDDEDGAAAVEYGLIAVLVSVAGLVALTTAGEAVDVLVRAIAGYIAPPG
jgi:pilus assembly protein Flp/PilA